MIVNLPRKQLGGSGRGQTPDCSQPHNDEAGEEHITVSKQRVTNEQQWHKVYFRLHESSLGVV